MRAIHSELDRTTTVNELFSDHWADLLHHLHLLFPEHPEAVEPLAQGLLTALLNPHQELDQDYKEKIPAEILGKRQRDKVDLGTIISIVFLKSGEAYSPLFVIASFYYHLQNIVNIESPDFKYNSGMASYMTDLHSKLEIAFQRLQQKKAA